MAVARSLARAKRQGIDYHSRMDTKAAPRASLRERHRLLAHDAILDAAVSLFLEVGYRKTTIGAIAETAQVGVATVFRYFKSKEGVLAALSQRDIDKILAKAQAAIVPPPADPVAGVMQILSAVLAMHDTPSTKIRGQTRLWLLIPTGHPETDEVVVSSDQRLQQMIQGLLSYYRRQGRLQKGDLRDMTVAIFAVFYHHYLQIAVDRTVRVADVEKDLTRRIALLFKPWGMQTQEATLVNRGGAGRRTGRSTP